MRWLLVALLTTAAAVAAGQDSTLPDGPGKAIVTSTCAGCHGLDVITAKQVSRQDWMAILDRMKSYGASLDDTQTNTVLDYLAQSFGPKGATPAVAGAVANAAADVEAKAMVEGLCSTCHGTDVIMTKKASKDDWAAVVERMKGYGAGLTDPQTTTLVDYLARTYGTAPPAVAGAVANAAADVEAMALVTGLCSTCHGPDVIMAKKASKEDWAAVVERMKGYGAVLTDPQTTTLVDYLARTYGTATAAAPEAAAGAAAKEDPGKTTMEGYCGTCHDLDLITALKLSAPDWQDIVNRMNSRGAGVPDNEIAPLVQYLAKTYGLN